LPSDERIRIIKCGADERRRRGRRPLHVFGEFSIDFVGAIINRPQAHTVRPYSVFRRIYRVRDGKPVPYGHRRKCTEQEIATPVCQPARNDAVFGGNIPNRKTDSSTSPLCGFAHNDSRSKTALPKGKPGAFAPG